MARNFKHIAECTQLNEHSEAIMLGAIYFGLDGVKSKIAKLIAEHIQLGYSGGLKQTFYGWLDDNHRELAYKIDRQVYRHAWVDHMINILES